MMVFELSSSNLFFAAFSGYRSSYWSTFINDLVVVGTVVDTDTKAEIIKHGVFSLGALFVSYLE